MYRSVWQKLENKVVCNNRRVVKIVGIYVSKHFVSMAKHPIIWL